VAERAYGQDEQVMISYGLKSSAECLEDHGTVPDIDMDEGDSHGAFMLCIAQGLLGSEISCSVILPCYIA
jgi:hypothetical protein